MRRAGLRKTSKLSPCHVLSPQFGLSLMTSLSTACASICRNVGDQQSLHVGFGRMVASETEAPNVSAINVDGRRCKATMRISPHLNTVASSAGAEPSSAMKPRRGH
jgi:hypothetical protein